MKFYAFISHKKKQTKQNKKHFIIVSPQGKERDTFNEVTC